jgi:ubiquinone/menaquinone biosynthesis C-methylase UbiE
VNHENAVSLIKHGVEAPGETWADLGAGGGTFSLALSELLGPTGMVIAVDRDHRALKRIDTPPASWAPIRTYHADFTQPLKLTNLDGLLLANALHFVAQQEKVLRQLTAYLRLGGRVLFLEYGTEQVSPWNPYPLPLGRLQQLAVAAGLEVPYEVHRRPSMFGGREFYAAVALK